MPLPLAMPGYERVEIYLSEPPSIHPFITPPTSIKTPNMLYAVDIRVPDFPSLSQKRQLNVVHATEQFF